MLCEKPWKTCVKLWFGAENYKKHYVFQRKTTAKRPKAMRNQVSVAGDPLRNHRAEQGTKESREDHEKPW